MLKLAYTATCLAAFGLVACGDSDGGNNNGADSSVVFGADAAAGGPDAQVVVACNPVAQTGCEGDRPRCTYIIDGMNPQGQLLGHTDCVPAGTAAVGESCQALAGEQGVDNCVEGAWCLGGECVPICNQAPDSCEEPGVTNTCVGFVGLFEDVDQVGLCQPVCDPLDPSAACEEGDACYLVLTTGIGSCGSPAAGAEALNQGDDCMFLNGCASGFGCIIPNNPDSTMVTSLACVFYCDAADSGGPTCNMSGDLESCCIRLSDFYADVTTPNTPDLGMCVNPNTWGLDPNTCMFPQQ